MFTNIVLGHGRVHPSSILCIFRLWQGISFLHSHFSNRVDNLLDSDHHLATGMILDHAVNCFGEGLHIFEIERRDTSNQHLWVIKRKVEFLPFMNESDTGKVCTRTVIHWLDNKIENHCELKTSWKVKLNWQELYNAWKHLQTLMFR